MTHCIIHIVTNFYQDIPYAYLVLACTRLALDDLSKGHNSKKVRKVKQSFLYVTPCLYLIYIVIKFQYDIPKGYLVMGCAKTLKTVLKN